MNMAYCRFENTYPDLKDCYDSLQSKDFSELSETEQKYRSRLVKMCKDIAEEYDVEPIKTQNP